ncbi:response regulator [Pseudoalteromonas aliena]|uniref:histidine kinase n=1 Tax=Pseudoalteromonas aliena SW19 TaxID=1314866 RepID=A0ABR9E3J6_9GAMM|nr:response regulator [Pseudoalteromonas aliena]MBE0360460.1 hypothetical protein [Pseudoalteromonas aliena SW19]
MFKVVANIRTRYQWALIAIAVLISISASLMQYFLSVQKYDAKIINIAGKQRMLSQKIAWHSNELLISSVDASNHIKALKASLLLFKNSHEYLLSKNDDGEYQYLTPKLVKLYTSTPNKLDSQVKVFIQEAESLLYQQGQVDRQIFSVTQVEVLLKQLDYAVSLFETEAITKMNWVSNLELLFWLAAMLLLLVELRFVFMPMEKEILNALTDSQKQKEFAYQVSKNKEHFIARASHEFRTPLQGLISSIETLYIKDEQKKIKMQAAFCASRIIAMLDELQDLQALSLGHWSLQLTNTNLLRSLERILTTYEYAYEQKGIRLITSFDSTLNCTTELDHKRLQQMLAELLSNALKFTVQGEVHIDAKVDYEQLIVTVKDTGCGFLSQVDSPVFNSQEQSNHFQGLRTGLARVQYIVKAFHGKILFENNEHGGALVTLKIPITINEPDKSKKTILPSTLHCLVVEDNPLNMLVLTRVLTSLGYSCVSAENGKVACEMVTRERYDVIFMDLNMPVMDGFEASKKIRTFDQSTPIIVVTANTSDSDIAYAGECGINAHVFKPIDKQMVIDVLAKVYSRK